VSLIQRELLWLMTAILQSDPSAADQFLSYLLNLGEMLIMVAILAAVAGILIRLVQG
jgi:hypothetical protein